MYSLNYMCGHMYILYILYCTSINDFVYNKLISKCMYINLDINSAPTFFYGITSNENNSSSFDHNLYGYPMDVKYTKLKDCYGIIANGKVVHSWKLVNT